jgi:Flp pilus assembly protein TadD
MVEPRCFRIGYAARPGDMDLPRSFSLLPLLALCAGCAAPDPPAHAPRTLAGSQRPEMLTRLGDDMRRSGDSADAIGFYRAASQAAPRDPAMLERMGDAFMDMNDPARAEQAFRGELVIDPGNVAAKRGLALALLAQGRASEALPILQRLAEGSSDPGLLRAEGTALDMVGRPADAQAVYRRALSIAPVDPDLHGNLALSLALSGDAAGALTEMQAAIAAPNPDPRQDANAVLVLALTGNADAARTRGDATIGAAATEALLARAQQALTATDARSRAISVGVLTGSVSGAPPAAATLLPPATAAPVASTRVAVTPITVTPIAVTGPPAPQAATDQAAGSPPSPAIPPNWIGPPTPGSLQILGSLPEPH